MKIDLLDVPNDILIHLGRFLETKDFFSFQLISQHVHKILLYQLPLLTLGDCHFRQIHHPKKQFEPLLRLQNYYRNIRMLIMMGVEDYYHNPDIKLILPKLTELRLQNSAGFLLLEMFANQLQKLEYKNVCGYEQNKYKSLKARLQSFSQMNFCNLQLLQFCEIDYWELQSIVTTATSISKICMKNMLNSYGDVDDSCNDIFVDSKKKTIEDMMILIFEKCTKLSILDVEVDQIQDFNTDANSTPKLFTGLEKALEKTKKIKRNALNVSISVLMSMTHLLKILNVILQSNITSFVFNFQGRMVSNFGDKSGRDAWIWEEHIDTTKKSIKDFVTKNINTLSPKIQIDEFKKYNVKKDHCCFKLIINKP